VGGLSLGPHVIIPEAIGSSLIPAQSATRTAMVARSATVILGAHTLAIWVVSHMDVPASHRTVGHLSGQHVDPTSGGYGLQWW